MVGQIVVGIIHVVNLVLAYGGVILGIFCVVDAASRRADAFVAADKQTKGTWVGITIACGVVLGMVVAGIFGVQGLFYFAAMIGVLIYLIGVRPRLKQVSGPHR